MKQWLRFDQLINREVLVYFILGYYTLDPSEGSSYDKFTAFCVKKTNATCVFPDTQEVREQIQKQMKIEGM